MKPTQPPRSTPSLLLITALIAACGGEEATAEPPPGVNPPTTAVAAAAPAPAPPPAPAVPTITLTPEETARVAEITGQVRRHSFPSSVKTKENAKIFLSLAATATDPNIIAAALNALTSVYTHSARYTERRELITPEYVPVVLSRIDHADGQVQTAAISALSTAIAGDVPDATAIARLVQLATSHPSPQGRHEAMDTLWKSSTIRTSQEQIAPYLQALDAPEAWIVSGALFRLTSFGRNVSDQAAYRTKLRGLLTHTDPGVRGRAAAAIAATLQMNDPERDALGQAIMPLLGDANPYVKSAAANALARMDYRPAIHTIMGLLDDTTRNTYDIQHTNLAGANDRSHHDGSPWSRVTDAAARAVQSFSSRMGSRIEFERVNPREVEAGLAAQATAARTWYAAHRAEIPAAP